MELVLKFCNEEVTKMDKFIFAVSKIHLIFLKSRKNSFVLSAPHYFISTNIKMSFKSDLPNFVHPILIPHNRIYAKYFGRVNIV